MTTILHKRGTGVPAASDAFTAPGEILIDTETGIAYTLTDDGDVVPAGGAGGGGGGDSLWEQKGSDIYYNDGNAQTLG